MTSESDEDHVRKTHPLVIAFRKHPIQTGVLVLVMIFTPFLLQVASNPGRPMFDRINLYWLAVGVVLFGVALAVLHRRARK